MILTRSELAKMDELFDAQELPDTFPDELEFSFLEVLAPTMTLQDYLAMPEQERRNGGSMPSLTAFFPWTSRTRKPGNPSL